MQQQVLIALASVIGLGVACQWIAWRLKIPAILLLLLTGLAAGAGTAYLAQQGVLQHRFLDPDHLFGQLLLPVVSLSVALILFEGGLTLNARELKQGGRVIWRLVSIGAIVSAALSSLAAYYVLDLPRGLALLIGAILVVTGPTVIGPLLRFVKPVGIVGPVLRWEGIVIDPIGALLAVVVFEAVAAGAVHPVHLVWTMMFTLAVGTVIGLIGAVMVVLLLQRNLTPDHLENPLVVMLVLVSYAASNAIQHEAGLAAVTVMGIALANQRRVPVHHILEFKESLSVLLIASLFILLGARLSLEQLAMLDWRVVVFIALLVLIIRPASVLAASLGSHLSWRERAFIAFMAPRGIVAAAVASVFALRLLDLNYPQADRLVPLTFAVVSGTVLVYGLTVPLLSRRLGLSRPGASGFLIVGAGPLGRMLGQAIHKEGLEVLLVDTNPEQIREARLAGLPVMLGNALSRSVGDAIALSSIGRMIAVTPSSEVNSLAVLQFGRQFGKTNVYQLSPGESSKSAKDKTSHDLQGKILFSHKSTYAHLTDQLEAGSALKSTKLTKEFDYNAYKARHGESAVPMFVVNDRKELSVVTPDSTLAPKPGWTILNFGQPSKAVVVADQVQASQAAGGSPTLAENG